MIIQKMAQAVFSNEYNTKFRRIYPLLNKVDTSWGSAIAELLPNTATPLGSHDEPETFIVLSGIGRMTVDEEVEPVETGDVIYIPPRSKHTIKNLSHEHPLKFLAIWW